MSSILSPELQIALGSGAVVLPSKRKKVTKCKKITLTPESIKETQKKNKQLERKLEQIKVLI